MEWLLDKDQSSHKRREQGVALNGIPEFSKGFDLCVLFVAIECEGALVRHQVRNLSKPIQVLFCIAAQLNF